jgi:hypothetical protein
VKGLDETNWSDQIRGARLALFAARHSRTSFADMIAPTFAEPSLFHVDHSQQLQPQPISFSCSRFGSRRSLSEALAVCWLGVDPPQDAAAACGVVSIAGFFSVWQEDDMKPSLDGKHISFA